MIKNSIFVSLIFGLCIFAQLSLEYEVDWFQYSRTEIASGQWWRLITGNLTHLNWQHFGMNAVALIAIVLLLPDVMKLSELFLVFLLSCLGVTLAIWTFSPAIYWYVGLSGALHGVLLVLLLLDITKHMQIWNIILFLLVVAKLIWESSMGALPGSEATAGGPVVVQAHLYGAVTAVIIYLFICSKNYIKNRKI